MHGLITVVSGYHKDNFLKENLALVYYDSSLLSNIGMKKGRFIGCLIQRFC